MSTLPSDPRERRIYDLADGIRDMAGDIGDWLVEGDWTSFGPFVTYAERIVAQADVLREAILAWRESRTGAPASPEGRS